MERSEFRYYSTEYSVVVPLPRALAISNVLRTKTSLFRKSYRQIGWLAATL